MINLEWEDGKFKIGVRYNKNKIHNKFCVDVKSKKRFGKKTQHKAYELVKEVLGYAVGKEETNGIIELFRNTTGLFVSSGMIERNAGKFSYLSCVSEKKISIEINDCSVNINNIKKQYGSSQI